MELVEGWKHSWKWWSVQADLLFTGILTYILTTPVQSLAMFREYPLLAVAAGGVMFALKMFARLAKQDLGESEDAEAGSADA